MTQTTATASATLNSLLRGEMSALETYRQALLKVEDENDPRAAALNRLMADHRDAADELWHLIEGKGERPSEGSGPWGAFAKAVEGLATLFGSDAALRALKEGEEHGLDEYEEALGDESLPPDARALIQSRYLPRQREHILALDRLIDQS